MADAGFFRGTNSEQDLRFSNKQKKLLKTLKFEDSLNTKVDMKRIDLDVMRLWITKRVSEILGMEDDVVVEFVLNRLEEEDMDPRNMQINLTGFLNAKKAREFMGELWDLLIDAQNSECGIPQTLINAKAEYLRSRSAEERLASLDDPPSPELKNDSPTAREESEERPVRGYDSSSKVSPSKSRDARHKERESRFRRRPIPSPRRSSVREPPTPTAHESKTGERRRKEEPEKYRSSRRKMQENRRDEKDRHFRYFSSYKSNRAKYDKSINEQRSLEKHLERKRSRSLSKEPNEKRISRKRENAYSSSDDRSSSTPEEERRSRRRMRDRYIDYYRYRSRRGRSKERKRESWMRYRRDADFADRRREENRKRRSRSDSPHFKRDERDYRKHRQAKQERDDRRRRDRVDEKNHKSYKKKRSRSIGESDSSVEDNVNRDRMSRKPQLKRERVKKRKRLASSNSSGDSSKSDQSPFERRISSPDTSHGLDEKIKCVDNRVNTPDKQRTESESEATGRTRKRSSQNITQTKDDSDISPAKVLKNSYTDNYGTSAEEEKEAENNQKNNKLYQVMRELFIVLVCLDVDFVFICIKKFQIQLQPPDGNKLSVNDDKVLPKNFTSDERKALEAVTPPLQRKSLGCKFDETDFDKELVKKKRSSSESLLDDEHSDEKKKAKRGHTRGKGESRGKSKSKNKEKERRKRDKHFSSVEESSDRQSKDDKKKKKKKSKKKKKKKRKHRHHSESSSSKKPSRRSRASRDSTSSDRGDNLKNSIHSFIMSL
ncbi:Serine/arginine repetitive matrix protein 1 [Trichinella spiralis]|uniref:Serine/arginine repetitive matrix protein 1 n=1 Tax=Trichinella spiralis TaxID=6334 RepID=A0A0V1B1Z3_TRISP|nr:Serine/arginine repetitive matrix protein 1 [Trichinella spiralis]